MWVILTYIYTRFCQYEVLLCVANQVSPLNHFNLLSMNIGLTTDIRCNQRLEPLGNVEDLNPKESLENSYRLLFTLCNFFPAS